MESKFSFIGTIYNTYYQWIPVYLNILALCFMIPKLLWTHIEGGVMKFIRGGTDNTPKEKRDKLLKVVIKMSCYFKYIEIKKHNRICC